MNARDGKKHSTLRVTLRSLHTYFEYLTCTSTYLSWHRNLFFLTFYVKTNCIFCLAETLSSNIQSAFVASFAIWSASTKRLRLIYLTNICQSLFYGDDEFPFPLSLATLLPESIWFGLFPSWVSVNKLRYKEREKLQFVQFFFLEAFTFYSNTFDILWWRLRVVSQSFPLKDSLCI